MGWREREWAGLTPSERRVLYGSRHWRLSTRRGTTIATATLFVIAALAIVVTVTGVGHRWAASAAHALRKAAHHVKAQAAHSVGRGRVTPIAGSKVAFYGGTYTLRGRTGAVNGLHLTGAVILQGRWNGSRWAIVARNRTDSLGRYSITMPLRRRGRLQLRVLMPDGSIGTKVLAVR